MTGTTDTPSTTSSKRHSGRRKGPESTREAILDAAIEVFAERGYKGATLRTITSKAGVDVALVSHFFGGKKGLFDEAVLRRAESIFRLLLDFEPGQDPVRQLLEGYFSIWENPDSALVVRTVFRVALETDEGRSLLQTHLNQNLASGLRRIAGHRGEAALRAFDQRPEEITLATQMLGSHLHGIALTRYILKISPIADVPKEALIDKLKKVVEVYLPEGSL